MVSKTISVSLDDVLSRRPLVTGVPSFFDVEVPDNYTAESHPLMPALVRCIKNQRLQMLRDIQSYEKTIWSFAEWDYSDCKEDESGWSEEAHKQWVVNMQLVSACALQIKDTYSRYQRYQAILDRAEKK